MKKFLALGSAALLLTCGGCQEESIVNEPVSAQPVSVRFALTLREDIEPFLRTRNLPGGLPGEPSAANASPDEEETPSTQPVSTLSYIEYAVYDNDTEELIEHRRYEVDGQDGSLQVQDELTAGIYKVCFLAHGVTDATFAEESSLVTFPEVEDTFWGFQEIEVDATQTDQSFSVGLARAVAGIECIFQCRLRIPAGRFLPGDAFRVIENLHKVRSGFCQRSILHLFRDRRIQKRNAPFLHTFRKLLLRQQCSLPAHFRGSVCIQNVGSMKSAVAVFRQLHHRIVVNPEVAEPDPAADFFHSGAQFFFIAPLRHFGENTLQLLIRLLFSRGDFLAVVFPLNGALPVQRQLALFCSLDCILNIS